MSASKAKSLRTAAHILREFPAKDSSPLITKGSIRHETDDVNAIGSH